MPGDPAVVEDAENFPAALSTANLQLLLSFLTSGLIASKPGRFSLNHSSALKELPAARPSLTLLCRPCPSLTQWKSWISSELLLPPILINILRTAFSGCMPWQIRPASKLSQACPCLETCYPLPWCQRCSSSFLLIIRPVSSYIEPSSNVSLLMLGPT